MTSYIESGGHVMVVPLTQVHATLNKQAVRIAAVNFAPLPLRAIIVLDASGSMHAVDERDSSDRKWELSLQIARKIVAFAPSGSSFGLLAFAGRDKREVQLTSDTASIVSALDQLRDYSGNPSERYKRTPLWDAIEGASGMLGSRTNHDTLIVIGDGADNYSRSTKKAVESQLTQSATRLFAVSFVMPDSLIPEEQQGPDNIRELAEDSGGYASTITFRPLLIKLHGEELLSSVAALVVEFASKAYDITLNIPELRKPEKLSLIGERKIRVLHPRTIAPCAKQ